jgi:hypothetical protein
MKLSFTFEPRMSQWAPQQIFNDYYEWFKNEYTAIDTEYINIDLFEKTVCGLYSPHVMVIRNIENKKYFLIDYWDKPEDFTTNYNGWDVENMVEHFSSAKNNIPIDITPISYCVYSKTHEQIAEDIRKPFYDKIENNLKFRGAVYSIRKELMDLNSDIVTNSILPIKEYMEEINNNKICLSLNGAAEICNRDMEILSVGSVLFRPILTQKFHNELINGVHYIGFDTNADPKIQYEIIKNKFNQIKDDIDLLYHISKNGLDWYKNNGTIKANVEILKKLINLEKLK